MTGGRLDDMGRIAFRESADKSTDIFEFQNEMHKIHFESTDTVNMAYIAPQCKKPSFSWQPSP